MTNLNRELDDIFIYTEPNCISVESCNEIIEKFILDSRKREGVVDIGVNKDFKNTFDLYITELNEWKDIDNELFLIINKSLEKFLKYIVHSHKEYDKFLPGIFQGIKDFGYQIQQYKKNEGYYNWHTDHIGKSHYDTLKQIKLLAFIIYLNDVNEGGETEFICGKIKPQAGKILFFPATWTYTHKGNMPISNDKYIITGWIGYDWI